MEVLKEGWDRMTNDRRGPQECRVGAPWRPGLMREFVATSVFSAHSSSFFAQRVFVDDTHE